MAEAEPSLGPSRGSTDSRMKFHKKGWKVTDMYRDYRHHRCRDPWPCTSLQLAAKIIAVVEFTVTILLIIPIVIAVSYGIKRKIESRAQSVSSADFFKITIVGLIIIPCVTIILDILLFVGTFEWSGWLFGVYLFTTIIIHSGEIILATIVAVICAKEKNTLLQVAASSALVFQIFQAYFKRVVWDAIQKYKPVQPQAPDESQVPVEPEEGIENV